MEQNNRPLGWTTIEESKQLIKAGLSVETADMSYTWNFDDSRYDRTTTPAKNWIVPKYAESTKIQQVLPCWSLGALLELIPKIYESEDDGGCYPELCKRYDTNKWHCLYFRDTLYKTHQYDFAIEAIVEMVIWLLKNGIIMKDKVDNSNYLL